MKGETIREGPVMNKLLWQMSHEELLREMERLQREAEQCRAEGRWNEWEVLKRRYDVARSHLVEAGTIRAGGRYLVEDHPGKLFTVTRVRGIMAYGRFSPEEEEQAFLLALLHPPGTKDAQ